VVQHRPQTQRLRAGPFVKWAGGKGQLLSSLLQLVPSSFNTYHEAFLGGGALFFALSNDGLIERAFLNDQNRELVITYTVIRDQLAPLLSRLSNLARDYASAISQADFYYSVRDRDPTSDLDIASRFIFLNKTCYNGLYRVNRRGRFNVPFGRHKKPTIFDPGNLEAVSRSLTIARITAHPFELALSNVSPGDFVYLDPPYQPITRTASFTGYTPNGFSPYDQQRLASEFARLDRLGAKVMLSNSDHHIIQQLYSSTRYDVREMQANRQINRDASKRGPITELIVRNYP
jgi:DNA adenine methylase